VLHSVPVAVRIPLDQSTSGYLLRMVRFAHGTLGIVMALTVIVRLLRSVPVAVHSLGVVVVYQS
jgi:hypothetical protein